MDTNALLNKRGPIFAFAVVVVIVVVVCVSRHGYLIWVSIVVYSFQTS